MGDCITCTMICPFDEKVTSANTKSGKDATQPYEVHITIDCEPEEYPELKEFCSQNSMKLIHIRDFNTNGTSRDSYMISEVFKGTWAEVSNFVGDCTQTFLYKNWKIIRRKIETLPWSTWAENRFPDQYRESHFSLLVHAIDEKTAIDKLKAFNDVTGLKLKFSMRKDKGHIFGVVNVFATYRTDDCWEIFEVATHQIKNQFSLFNFTVEKVISEFTVYDSNLGYDEGWR